MIKFSCTREYITINPQLQQKFINIQTKLNNGSPGRLTPFLFSHETVKKKFDPFQYRYPRFVYRCPHSTGNPILKAVFLELLELFVTLNFQKF